MQYTNIRYSITLNDAQLDYLSDEQQDILRSESSNRTTIHTLICLSVWFTGYGMIKSSFFDSKPVVKPIVKPPRTTKRVPPETAVETRKSDGATPANPGGAQ